MKYFAYGSNMSLVRLQQRTPSAKLCGCFKLVAHSLRFHKVGQDGSGKCDAFYTADNSDYILGALFEIDDIEKPMLDKVEGLGFGYDEKQVSLSSDKAQEVIACLYIATNIDPMLKPYSWYKNHVLIGAKESGLPSNYIQKITLIENIEDSNKKRDAQQRAIYI
ncbi:gamma-glutamylcyclotransferase family protein [Pseudoalteromonas denitrificans]|uniref:AIG2-like family protein n=1 Tax=Pseudoalteromonas denitrificans DSM 6059 TaxID=1123010 RepID=A0A1I1TSC7_9GAMM|nr:gamma-glutamylcyclotransferase family protein [Pseudoalteromonas denitrificans]SFD58420.1 AIG2-like family protein [Pseudoalteromonas denitrificans DSM 6059]